MAAVSRDTGSPRILWPAWLAGRFTYALAFCLLGLSSTVFAPAQVPSVEKRPGQAYELLKPGVVVEKFDDDFSGAKKAGLQEGDVLLSWSRGEAKGKFETPFDVSLVMVEEVQRGPVNLEGTRGAEKQTWTVVKQYWGATMRPNFTEIPLAVYREGERLVKTGKPIEAAARWREAADQARGSQFWWLGPWFLSQAGHLLAENQQWKEADDAYQEAIAQSSPSEPVVVAQLLFDWAETFFERSDWEQATRYFQQSMVVAQKAGLRNLTANCFNALGWIARGQGDLIASERYFRQAYAIQDELEPSSLASAGELINIGIAVTERGDIAKGEECYLKALAVYEKQAPNSNGIAYILDDLAEVARLRGDLDRAEAYLRKSRAIVEHINPGILSDAVILNDLASVLAERGDNGRNDVQQAEELLQQSLAIKEKVAPGSLEVAQSRQSLGDIAERRGDLRAAEQRYLEALEIREKLSPESLPVAESLHCLGDVGLAMGEVSKAEAYYRRALAIREKLAAGTMELADSLAGMARITYLQHRPEEAQRFYGLGLQALESQTVRLGGGSEIRAGFRAKHENYYREYIDLLVSTNKPDLAFQALERSRARTLLETLAFAHIDVHHGADPVLLERERSLQSDIKAKSERRIHLLSEKHAEEKLRALQKEITELTSEYQDVESQVRSASPSYSALTQPQPLNARQIQQQLLDQDTLLLEYSLGEERSHVFAVTPDSLQAFDLPKRTDIERAARRVYGLLTANNRAVRGETSIERKQRRERTPVALPQALAELARMVLEPLAAQLQGKRLLIVGDGALDYIPFAVLPEPQSPATSSSNQAAGQQPIPSSSAASTPLIVKHEVINLPSASVLAVLRQQELDRPRAPRAVAVLADPVFERHDPRVRAGRATSPAATGIRAGGSDQAQDSLLPGWSSAGLLTRSAADLGMARNGQVALPRLRYSRLEANSILAVTPAGQGMEAVDFRANRAAAIDPGLSQYRIVHFATHGLLNSEHPELSGLVLSLVNEKGQPQDGFLELQDIYNLNLPADLVVLSACETGLGKQINGEGLVGLTRGFMYAGASRVVASLWKVSDAATARLMADFYSAMERDGLRPAAALRSAQVRMWRQRRWSSPYFWAAFQIQGEWK